MLKLPNFSPEEMRGLRRTFAMYVKFPKNRWKDIEKAESFDDEGNKVWNELRQEYLDRFLNNPETAITEQGNSKESRCYWRWLFLNQGFHEHSLAAEQ